MPIRKRIRAVWFLAFVLGGCAPGRGVLHVTVDGDGPVTGIAALRVTVSRSEALAAPVLFQLPDAPATIPPARTFNLAFDGAVTGDMEVRVDALGADGGILSSGTAAASVAASRGADLRVILMAGNPRDLGSDAARDAKAEGD